MSIHFHPPLSMFINFHLFHLFSSASASFLRNSLAALAEVGSCGQGATQLMTKLHIAPETFPKNSQDLLFPWRNIYSCTTDDTSKNCFVLSIFIAISYLISSSNIFSLVFVVFLDSLIQFLRVLKVKRLVMK